VTPREAEPKIEPVASPKVQIAATSIDREAARIGRGNASIFNFALMDEEPQGGMDEDLGLGRTDVESRQDHRMKTCTKRKGKEKVGKT
jgi:hypothetical protein